MTLVNHTWRSSFFNDIKPCIIEWILYPFTVKESRKKYRKLTGWLCKTECLFKVDTHNWKDDLEIHFPYPYPPQLEPHLFLFKIHFYLILYSVLWSFYKAFSLLPNHLQLILLKSFSIHVSLLILTDPP